MPSANDDRVRIARRDARLIAFAAVVAGGPACAQDRNVEEIVNSGAAGATLQLSTGIDFSSGRYGEADRTEILVVPASIRVRAAEWLSLGASLAWIRIDGPGAVLGPDNQPLPGFPVARQVRSGLGDLSASATVSVPTGSGSPWLIDLTGRVKLPTANKRRGLTTGKTDFSIGADVSYAVGNWAPFVDFGIRFAGDPAGIALRDSPSVSLGAAGVVGKGAVIFSYDWQRAFSPLAKDSHSLFGAYSHRAARHLDLTGYASIGLSDGAAAAEGGLLLTFKLD